MESQILVDAHLFVPAGVNLIICNSDVDDLMVNVIAILFNMLRTASAPVSQLLTCKIAI